MAEQGLSRPASRPVSDPIEKGSHQPQDQQGDMLQDQDKSQESHPVSHSVADNSEHTLEQSMANQVVPPPVRCECDNARCAGHYRKSFCTGIATHGAVHENRPQDPMRVMCETCHNHTMETGGWTTVDGAMERYHSAQDMHLDPQEETRRSARVVESERAARTEMAPEANPGLTSQRSVESQKAAQEPQRDVTVPVLQDSYQTTSQIPVLDPPKSE